MRFGGRGIALALLCVAQFVVVLDVTIVAIALPVIQDSLGFSRGDLQWVVSAYTLAFGGFLMLAGRVADLRGRRLLFMVGLALFSGASLACGLAWSPLSLVAARVAQGVGAAIVAPSALSLLTTNFDGEEERGFALGVWTAAAAGGGAAGWILGGLISENLGWEWVFLVNVPIGILGLMLAPMVLDESRDPSAPPRLDVAGAVTVTVGLTLLVYGLTRAEASGLHSSVTVSALGGSLALIAAFVAVEKRAKHPLVPLEVFRSRDLTGSSLVAMALTAATMPTIFVCTLYAQQILGRSPAEAGFLFVPVNLSVIAGSLFGVRIIGAVGEKAAMVYGLLAVAVGALSLLGLSPDGGYLLPGFVLMGAGLGVASVASTARGTSVAEGGEQGLSSGLLNSAAQIGTALGLAVLIPLSAPTDSSAEAVVEGFRWAFFGAAGIATLGALISLPLLSGIRSKTTE